MVDADQISVSDLYKMVSTLTAFKCVSDVCIFIPEAVNHSNILLLGLRTTFSRSFCSVYDVK